MKNNQDPEWILRLRRASDGHAPALLERTPEHEKELDFWIRLAEDKIRTRVTPALLSTFPESHQKLHQDILAFLQQGYNLPLNPCISHFFVCLEAAREPPQPGPRRRPQLAHLPDELTKAERLEQLLEIVWADVSFWRLMHQALPAPEIDESLRRYLRRQHLLLIEFPAVVWQQMVRKPLHKRYLFALTLQFSGDSFSVGDPRSTSEEPAPDLSSLKPEALGKLLDRYIRSPLDDHQPHLALHTFPAGALNALASACHRLAADAKSCRSNNNTLLAGRAPKPPFAPYKLEKALVLERLVQHLHCDPSLREHPSKLVALELGKPTSKQRRYGAAAIELFQFRECFHDENSMAELKASLPAVGRRGTKKKHT